MRRGYNYLHRKDTVTYLPEIYTSQQLGLINSPTGAQIVNYKHTWLSGTKQSFSTKMFHVLRNQIGLVLEKNSQIVQLE